MKRAVIIGAGPGGSTAAIDLARRGWCVTLVEQHRFPRDKVCGECLSPLAIDVLKRLDLLRTAKRLGAVSLRRTILHSVDGKAVELELPREMLGISRKVFDQILLYEAARAGARIVQPARCERVEPRERPHVQVRDLVTNALWQIGADVVIVSEGKGTLAEHRPTGTGDFGLKAHFVEVNGPRNSVELFSFRGHYGGLAAIEDGVWNVAMSVPQDLIREHAEDLERLWRILLEQNAGLRERMRPARRVSEWLVSPLPRFGVIGDWPAGVIPVGNAAAALEPIGGEGIGLAMRSAEMAAEWVDQGRAGDGLFPQYRRLWQVRRLACRAAAKVVSSKFARVGLELLESSGEVQRAVLGWTGK